MLTKDQLKEFEFIDRKANERHVPQESLLEAVLKALQEEAPSLTYLNHGKRINEPFADAVIAFIKHQIDTFGRPRHSAESMPQVRNYYELEIGAKSKSDRVEAWIKCMKSEGRVAPVQEPRLKAILNSLPEDDRLCESLRQLVNATPSLFTILANDAAEGDHRKNAEDSDEEIAYRVKLFQQSKSPLTEVMESAIIKHFQQRIQLAKREKDPARAWVLSRCLGSFKGILEQKTVRDRRELFQTFAAFADLDTLFNKRHPDSLRLKAAQRILTEQIRRPIHPARWNTVKKELYRLAEINRRSSEVEFQELATASLFEAIEALGRVKLTSSASFDSQISVDRKAVWNRLSKSLTELLAGPWWRQKEIPRKKKTAPRNLAAAKTEKKDDTGPTAQPRQAGIDDPTDIGDETFHAESSVADEQIRRKRLKLLELAIQMGSLKTGKKPEDIARLIAKGKVNDIKSLARAFRIERTSFGREIVKPIRELAEKNRLSSRTRSKS